LEQTVLHNYIAYDIDILHRGVLVSPLCRRHRAVVGMDKLNFSGGEPFLPKKGSYVGELVMFCKQELELSSVTIVSNGSLINEDWFAKYGV